MQYQTVLKKMMTELNEVVHYYLDVDNDFLNLNQLLAREIEISFSARKGFFENIYLWNRMI